jgi:hypothetical protein
MRRSQRLTGDADALERFLAAYNAPETDANRVEVDRLAGPASIAFDRSGMRVSMFGADVNPVLNWAFAPPDRFVSSCNAAIGRLRAAALDAARVERSLAGRVARFVGFPGEVRAAMSTSSRAAQRVGWFAAVLVNVAAIVIGAGVLALMGFAIAKL